MKFVVNLGTFAEYAYANGTVVIYSPNGSAKPFVLSGFALSVFNAIKTNEMPQNISQEEYFRILQQLNTEKIITCDTEWEDRRPLINISKGRTISFWIHTTDSCNLQCSYCYVKKGTTKLTEEIARKLVSTLKIDATERNVKKLHLKFAGGEPLLALDSIVYLAKYAIQELTQHGVKVEFSIITNGTLLTQKNIAILKDLGIRVMVSLDGIGDYNSVRIYKHGGSSYNDVVSNIELALSHNVKPTILTVLSNHNLAGLETLIDFVQTHGLSMSLSFNREYEHNNKKLAINMEEVKKYLIPQLQKLMTVHKVELPRIYFGGITFKGRKKRICGAGANYFAVGTEGTVSSCQMSINTPIVENIPQNGMLPLSTHYQAHIQSTECSCCVWRYVCCGGCDFLAEQTKSWGGTHKFCEIYKEVLPYILMLEGRYLQK